MKRVIVIGCPGAGKSAFSKKLAAATGLPLIHLDNIWHRPDRTTVSKEEFDARLGEVMKGEEWILDGNYNRTLERRLGACDAVFLFDLPTQVCLEGARARIGRRRDDLPWVEEELDPEFEQWIKDFRADQLPETKQLLERYRGKREIHVFRMRQEADEFIAKMTPRG